MKTFHVTAPDGKTLEITGPDDATPEQAIEQAKQQYKPDQADLNHLFGGSPTNAPAGGKAPEDRSASEVAIDQAMNVGKGAVGAVTGIPGMVKEGAGIVGDALTGKAGSVVDRLRNVLSGAAHSVVDPIAASARGAAAYVAPDSVKAPSSQDWEKAAKDAGALAGNAVVGKVAESIPTSAEGIQGVANKLRSIKAQTQPGVPLTATQAVRAGIGAAAEPAAALAEKAARLRAALDTKPNVDVPTPEPGNYPPAPATPKVQTAAEARGLNESRPLQVAEATPEQAAPGAPAAQPPANAVNEAFLRDLREQSQIQNTPDLEMRQPSTPATPIEPNSGIHQMWEDIEQRNQPVSYRTIPPPRNPIEPTPELQQLKPVAHPDAGTAPTPVEISMAREAVLKDGAPRSTATLLKVSRNVPELLKTVPELKGVPPGAGFNTRLFNAYDRIGHELNATEASIPDNTQVSTGDAVKKLTSLEEKYINTNQPSAVRAIDKVKSFLADRPSMAWGDFIQAKRAFFNEIKLSSGIGQEAYQVFKKLSNDVSPELGELNQKYYVVKSALENAAMDMRTGEKIRTIGKPAKPPIPPSTGGFVTPL